ncbi:MAG: TonB-dependent receptor [Cyclobacteriaceae bacterium]
MKNLFTALLLLGALSSFGQEKYTLSGYVKDASNGETLIGATVLVREISSGNITNVYGFYSLTLPSGDYTVKYSYVGYETIEKTVSLTSNQRIDVEMQDASEQLEAVVVSARAADANVSQVEMSTNEMDMKTIEKIPAFLGEVDVIKSLQLLPGVATVGEGASGFNVRGGSVGQNLVLLDEAPVYNSSHMFGFFSVFNPDAVKDVKLYKGGVPAQYGGRLASILDVRMKEGNNKNYEVNGGIGTIFSRFAVEGPIKKEKASFIIAGRRSYIDVLARPFLKANDLDGVGLYFYDFTAKANYNINEKNRIYISGYFGRDVFAFDERQGFGWGNETATLRWNHLFSDRLFSNTTMVVSNYDYGFHFGQNADDEFIWDSDVYAYNFKQQFSWFVNTNNEVSFGGEALLYRFLPAEVEGSSAGERQDFSLDTRKGLETSLYLGNEQRVTSQLTLQYGLRFSNFSYLGAGTVYHFNDTTAGSRRTVVSETQADKLENIKSYNNLEPRFGFNYQLNQSTSVKGSYQRMVQYVHLISNTAATLPTDVWVPSTNNLKPQKGHQVALGVFKNFLDNKIEASIETYYKFNHNQVEYIDGAEVLINPTLEADLISGVGRAYGLEFFVKKPKGKITGWMSYTLARTELKVDGVNDHTWYPTRFDQTHNLKITGNYDLSRKWSFSTNFTYITGTPTTLPVQKQTWGEISIPVVVNRHNSRIPDYHRLDVSATLQTGATRRNGKDRWGGLMKDSYWVFTVYNLYGRENPFAIYFSPEDVRVTEGALAGTSARQTSILGTWVPAVSYNFKF